MTEQEMSRETLADLYLIWNTTRCTCEWETRSGANGQALHTRRACSPCEHCRVTNHMTERLSRGEHAPAIN